MTIGAISTVAELEALYGTPNEASTIKVGSTVDGDYATLVGLSPFALLATVGPEGLDASPRGDRPGFVRIVDPHTLQMPDRRGNNRIDSLRNIVRDPRVALLFSFPARERRCASTVAVACRPISTCSHRSTWTEVAANRRRDRRDLRLLPMRPRHRPIRPMELRAIRRSETRADTRRDSGNAQSRKRRR
jgi:predicted pyridoxine 5'-phosphate oxidase superfamily flavin-nucleotide-binding protein